MFWVPLIMGAAALSGAVMSANGKKYIDPAWIEEHTGSHAFAQEFNNMFNQLQATPQGQEMINSAMSQGAQVANTIRQNATNAGFGGAEGVQSGGSLFATSVADSAPSSLRRMATAAIGQQAQANVSEILQRRLNAYLAERQQPSKQEVIGNLLQQGGMLGLQASLNAPPGKTPTDKTLETAATAASAAGASKPSQLQRIQGPAQNTKIEIPQPVPDVAPIPYEITGEDLVSANQLPGNVNNPYLAENPNSVANYLAKPEWAEIRNNDGGEMAKAPQLFQRMPKAPITEMQRMGYGGRVPFMFGKYNPSMSHFTDTKNATPQKRWVNTAQRTSRMLKFMQSPQGRALLSYGGGYNEFN